MDRGLLVQRTLVVAAVGDPHGIQTTAMIPRNIMVVQSIWTFASFAIDHWSILPDSHPNKMVTDTLGHLRTLRSYLCSCGLKFDTGL